ncbi:unnamed protein product [Parascedosporium putredinis]|uniref:NTF2-like protein n=1 Tax=Parascedosporium putredinis TaxID=1442378 RepID=A0A9P1H783_9PEZI|nr:unnamed protein product [Parascedosporium putredinis]CAI7998414.1 unnamed protein product [Parascedosporium putredinis]
MASTYRQFLASPNSSLLAANASLHYITTTTTIRGATDIIKHLNTLRNQIKKGAEDFLDVIEGRNATAIQTKTTITFVLSGGPYLPGLDDNFLADREVHLPIMHIVAFDDQGKIAQIRQSWDQGALLKQIEVIGKTGRNWPIRDGSEQIKAITTCLSGGSQATTASAELPHRSRGNSTNALRDPYASLEIFGSRDPAADAAATKVISPYAGTRPRERSFNEILGDEPYDEDDGSPSRGRSQSPSKEQEEEEDGRERSRSQTQHIAPKAGSSKNFQPSRLFEVDEAEQDSPDAKPKNDRFYRPNPKRFQHFDFDGDDSRGAEEDVGAGTPGGDRSRSRSKHDSSWSFDDFVTPQKSGPAKGRRDAQHHFEYSEDGEAVMAGSGQAALGNITNTSLRDRKKTFDAQFTMTDEPEDELTPQPRKVSEDRKKAVKMMEANWAAVDVPPPRQNENLRETAPAPGRKLQNRGIVIAGDGMGSRKTGPGADRATEKKIHIGGDGMGGKKGTVRDWLLPEGE